MAPTVEVLFAPSTPEYREDPTLMNGVAEIVVSKGALGAYHGVPVEDNSTLFLIVVWETVDAHKALIEDKELYAKLHVEFAKAVDLSKINMFHVNFEPDANLPVLLNATYTSFAHVSAYKPGHSAAELHGVFKGIVDVPNVPGCLGGAFGKALEKDDYVLLFGWDDPKYHGALVEKAGDLLKQAFEIAESAARGHVKFHAYKKYQG